MYEPEDHDQHHYNTTVGHKFHGPFYAAEFGFHDLTLNIEVNGSGSVTPSEGTYSYSDGDIVNIVATPNSGWRFDSWIGDVSDTKSPTTKVNMNTSKNVAANFVKVYPVWFLPLIIIATLTLVGIGVWYYLTHRNLW